jgi:hypothetical protein
MPSSSNPPEPSRRAALIVRRDGRDAVMAKPERQGWYSAGDRIAAHFVLYRESEKIGLCLVTVQVSSTATELLRRSSFVEGAGLDSALDVISECAIGDFLDHLEPEQVPLPQHTPPRDEFWDSTRLQELFTRRPVREADAVRYLAAKTYWARKLRQPAAGLRAADARRLGYELRDLKVSADTYEGEWWTYMADAHPDVFYLKATQALLQRGPLLMGNAVAGPVFNIRDYLKGAPDEASAQQFRKALGFLGGDHPDYENAVKEAVGAVESRARQMTRESTLGRAADALLRAGRIPRPLARWLHALYDYRSSMPAVAHGGLEPAGTENVEARALVNSCSAALLYLLELGPTRVGDRLNSHSAPESEGGNAVPDSPR